MSEADSRPKPKRPSRPAIERRVCHAIGPATTTARAPTPIANARPTCSPVSSTLKVAAREQARMIVLRSTEISPPRVNASCAWWWNTDSSTVAWASV